MVSDRNLGNLVKVLEEYIEEIGYKARRKPFVSNMTLDKNGAFVTLPEFQIFATAKNPDGLVVSLSIIPSKKAIFIEKELVKKLD